MKKLIFATGNPNKIKEVNQLLDGLFPVIGMREIGCTEEVPETQNTLQGNALQKARYLKDNYKYDCFSEDTGLEIDALDGAPGVITAHYAGPERDAIANMEKVLLELKDKEDRGAQFRTVIALIWEGKEHLFEGIVRGRIALERSGEKGFGYDPIFIPEGYDQTFANIGATEKNSISHRGRAVKQLIDFFKKSK
ncbi:MAG: non-canonical purine NTP diphosphatase [Saprospiraceae bacterium]